MSGQQDLISGCHCPSPQHLTSHLVCTWDSSLAAKWWW